MVVMMGLTWKSISNVSETKRSLSTFEERNHELRMALNRIASDFEAAYLSKNEDQASTHPRTMFIAKSNSKLPEVRFSTLGHRVLWADANESEQTVISYMAHSNAEKGTDWIRREQRRPSNLQPEEEPAEYDVLVHDIISAKLEFWNWKNAEWQDTWDTTQSDGQRGWLPSRVRITIVVKGSGSSNDDYKLTTQARIMMQEPLNFVQ